MIKRIKKFLLTTVIVVAVFLLIFALNLTKIVFNQGVCTGENPNCPQNFICNVNDHRCVQAEKCPDVNQNICITLYDPVCGNNIEYSNSCYACASGVKYYYKGKC